MKTIICRVPVRDYPTGYPPFGAMAITKVLRKHGFYADLYDIDYARPSFDEIREKLIQERPDVIGVSAVTATSYKFTKELCHVIREILPHAVIIVGGGLAWNSEVLLKYCNVDYCVIGEGIVTIIELMGNLQKYNCVIPDSVAMTIKGIAFKGVSGKIFFTNFREQVNINEIEMDDFSLIDINHFIYNPLKNQRDAGWLLFDKDKRSFEPHRVDKKLVTLYTSKGCVNRCTFCHRMEKGIRIKSVQRVIEEIQNVKEKYNVGFIFFGDEDFGASKQWVYEFAKAVKPLDVLYAIQGMRVDHVNPEILLLLRESGCIAVFYGTESGSQKMLDVMEKHVALQENLEVLKWTYNANLLTTIQLVLGMPGETDDTIEETIDFLKLATQYLPDINDIRLSIKYILCCPNTPLYEYAQLKGFIGKDLQDEERYLLNISHSDPDPYNPGFINFTEADYYTLTGWARKISWAVRTHYIKNRIKKAGGMLAILSKKEIRNMLIDKRLWLNKFLPAINFLYYLKKDIQEKVPIDIIMRRVMQHFKYKIFGTKRHEKFEYISLREMINKLSKGDANIQDSSLYLLRKGR